jgi:hypothetical protein
MLQNNSNSNFVFGTILFLLLIFSPFNFFRAHAEEPKSDNAPLHGRVIWTADPSTQATLSWSTPKRGETHTVRYRIKDDSGPTSTVLAESGRFTGGEPELYYHHARLAELQPSTAYEVEFISDKVHSEKMYFITGPDDDRSFSILHGGDSRSDHGIRRTMNRLIGERMATTANNKNPDDDILAFAHGGDFVGNGKNVKQWSQWLSDHELTRGTDGRLLPIIPTRGNHDHGTPFNEVFGFPEADKNIYALDLGTQVRWITLNTEISTGGDQAKWLEQELKESRPKYRWMLAQHHYPVYPAVKGIGSAFHNWAPLYEKYNLDLACESDGHNIKRTFPIRDGKQDPTGVVYIGEGGLGAPQRTPKTDRWYLGDPGIADKGNHVFMLTFEKEKLTIKCITADGKIFDTFDLKPRE